MPSANLPAVAPLEVRDLLPAGYLKLVQAQLARKGKQQYSDTTISRVVRDTLTAHTVWPVVLRLARAEKLRRQEEAALNAQYLQLQDS